jgi:hypothetical protein
MRPREDLVSMRSTTQPVQDRFARALDALVAEVKEDRSILAAFLCGSLAYDVVWAKSDIDLMLITIDDEKVKAGGWTLDADGVTVHAMLVRRAAFRKTVESSGRDPFMHSLLANGRLLYTHDETIAELCSRLQEIGGRDRQVRLFGAAMWALMSINKAHKWFVTRGDLDYTALWILYAATPLAQIEVISAGLVADREVILRALELNPSFFGTVYTDLLNTKKTRKRVQAALDAVDGYLAPRAAELFRPVLDHLAEVGEARSCTEIEDHFRRNLGIGEVGIACEYLADQGLIGRVSLPVQLTRRSNVRVQELAFVLLEGGPDGD